MNEGTETTITETDRGAAMSVDTAINELLTLAESLETRAQDHKTRGNLENWAALGDRADAIRDAIDIIKKHTAEDYVIETIAETIARNEEEK